MKRIEKEKDDQARVDFHDTDFLIICSLGHLGLRSVLSAPIRGGINFAADERG